ncbi:YhdP family protein [Ferrimonas lipolytica]|uniref:TIGR02099 family protein n=1 Tax=Ferrimonas lipolytica TaxID=2724191 RepID=A0A6H1UI63_9GAMM|nr:YhdP family protein [Ferrimonas lipolytica]QIZ77906.1 TIGR02099 family protein [Ferrimonas lipolytica]
MSLTRFSQLAGRFCWNVLALALVLLALAVSLVRSLLPQLDGAREQLTETLQQRYGIELSIDELGAQWYHNGPHLVVKGVSLPAQAAMPLQLSITQLELKLDFWQTLIEWSPQFDTISINGVELELHLTSDSSDKGFDYQKLKPLQTALLQQVRQLSFNNIAVDIRRDQQHFAPIYLAEFHWRNLQQRHLGQGKIYLDQARQDNEQLLLTMEVEQRDKDGFQGRAYLQAQQLDLGEWIQRHLNEELQPVVDGIDYSGVLNLESWISFNQSGLLQAQWQLDGSRFSWQDNNKHELSLDSGSFLWRPTVRGWELNSSALALSNDGNAWPLTSIQGSKVDRQLSLQLGELPLDGLKPLLGFIPSLNNALITELSNSEAQGQIGPLVAQRRDEGWFAQLSFNGLGWQQQGQLPGFDGLSGQIDWQAGWANIRISGDQLSVDWPSQLASVAELPTLELNLQWVPQSLGSVLRVTQAQIGNDDVSVDAQAALQFTPQQSPRLQLGATLQLAQASELKHYLPSVMGQSLADYLGKAIQHGHFDDGRLIWHGDLDQYPYQQQQGRFLAGFSMQQLQFNYLPQWPAAKEGYVDARFENARMDLLVERALLAGVAVADVDIIIPSLGPASQLQILGALTAQPDQVQAVLAGTFLEDSVGGTLDIIQPQQALPLSLDMSFNLGSQVKHLQNQVNGVITLWDHDIYIAPLQLPLEQVRGEIRFNNNIISANNLMTKLLAQPTELSILAEPQQQGYGIDIDLSSHWQVSRLPEQLDTPLTPFFQGGAAISGEIDLLVDEQLHYTGELNSTLAGMAIDLPAPLGKNAIGESPLQLRIQGDSKQAQLELELGTGFGMVGELGFDNTSLFERYLLALGEAPLLLPQQHGGKVHWIGDELLLESWLPLIDSFSSKSVMDAPDTTATNAAAADEKDGSTRGWFAGIDNVVLEGQQLQLYQIPLGSGQISAVPQTGAGWKLQLDTDRTQSIVYVGEENDQLKVEVDAAHFYVAELVQAGAEQLPPNLPTEPPTKQASTDTIEASLFAAATSADIDSMPALTINIDDFRVGPKRFGQAKLVGYHEDEHYRLETFEFGYDKHKVRGQGIWLAQGNTTRTRISGNLNSQKVDKMTEYMAVEPSIEDAKANVDFQFSWQGAPWQVQLTHLDGNVAFKMTEGRLRQVSDKGARLLSVFSLESLARKLALDFSDVFGSGMHFSEFGGNISLADGVATTKDGRMDGSAGVLKVDGWTNLHTRELDYQLSFSPALASSVPAVMYLSTGTLAIGLSVFAVTKLLEPVIEVVTQLKYHLTGTLDEPELIEVERLKREVEIRDPETSSESQSLGTNDNGPSTVEHKENDDEVPPAAANQPTQPAIQLQSDPAVSAATGERQP